jgi:hypothetical protein
MISENDSLRGEVKSLNRSVQKTLQSTYSTQLSSSSIVEGLTREILDLRGEILVLKEQRDNAHKEILIVKQVSMFYKHKDDEEERAILNQLFTLDQLIKKKDNIIHRLEG